MRASVYTALALLALCATCWVLADAAQLTLDSAGRELLQNPSKQTANNKTPAQKRPAASAGGKPSSPTKKQAGSRNLLEEVEVSGGRELLQTPRASSTKNSARRPTANAGTKTRAAGQPKAAVRNNGRHLLEDLEVIEGRELLQSNTKTASPSTAGQKRPKAASGNKQGSPSKQPSAVKKDGRHLLDAELAAEGRELLQKTANDKPAPQRKQPAASTKRPEQKRTTTGKHLLSEEDLQFEARELLQTKSAKEQSKPKSKQPAASTKKTQDKRTTGKHLLSEELQFEARELLQKETRDKSKPKSKQPAASTRKTEQPKKGTGAGKHLLSEEDVELEGRELLQQKTTNTKQPSSKKPQAASTPKANQNKKAAPSGRNLLQKAAEASKTATPAKQTRKPAAKDKSSKKPEQAKTNGRHLLSEVDVEDMEGRQLLAQPNTQQKKQPGKNTPAANTAKPSATKTTATKQAQGRHLLQKTGTQQQQNKPGKKTPAATTAKPSATKTTATKQAQGRHLLQRPVQQTKTAGNKRNTASTGVKARTQPGRRLLNKQPANQQKGSVKPSASSSTKSTASKTKSNTKP